MTEMRFTPGPWKAQFPEVVTEDGRVICDVRHAGTFNKNESLIAAAPDLFDCLVDLLEKAEQANEEMTGPVDRQYFSPSLIAKARAAIAGAKGEHTDG